MSEPSGSVPGSLRNTRESLHHKDQRFFFFLLFQQKPFCEDANNAVQTKGKT